MKYIIKQFWVVIILICAAIFQSCSNKQIIGNKQTVSLSPPTVSVTPAIITHTQPASCSPSVSATANVCFPLSPDEFQKIYHVEALKGNWKPTSILEYTEDWTHIPEITVSRSKWHIVSSGGSSIQVNEVTWVEDNAQPNGFRIDNPSPEIKTYPLDKDVGIWLLIGASEFYRIPVTDLATYINSAYGPDTVWNYTIKDGKVVLLTEQYIP